MAVTPSTHERTESLHTGQRLRRRQPADLPGATITLLAVALAIALLNATAEELLWHGVHLRLFPRRLITGWLYPAVGFALLVLDG